MRLKKLPVYVAGHSVLMFAVLSVYPFQKTLQEYKQACKQKHLNAQLLEAVRQDNTAFTAFLLESGANPNTRDIHLENESLYSFVVNRLLGKRSIETKAPTVLLLAMERKQQVFDWGQRRIVPAPENVQMVRELLKWGADMNARGSVDYGRMGLIETTPLLRAENNGYQNITYLLIQAGANVNATDALAFTPLMEAALGHDVKLVQSLIERKANLNNISYNGETALRLAVDSGNKKMANLLKKYGAQSFP